MDKKIREKVIKLPWFYLLAYSYIAIPFLLFAMGWIKTIIAVPICVLVIIGIYKAAKSSTRLWVPAWNKDLIVKCIFIFLLISLWVYFSGVGTFVFQNVDHAYRNGIFQLLIDESWPIIFENGAESKTGLVYYIGYWLPSAIVGKIFGLKFGYVFQAIWAVVGIVIVYYLICCMRKKIEIWPLIVFICFSGMYIIGVYLTEIDPAEITKTTHLEWWSTPYQFSSITSQLFWVFNQAVPAWVATMLMVTQKNMKTLVFILGGTMINSTFSFVGLLILLPLFIYDIMKHRGIKIKNKKLLWLEVKEIFSYQNVVAGGIMGIISFLFLILNIAGTRVMGENIKGPFQDPNLSKWIVFFILDIGVYFIILYKHNRDKLKYYYLLIMLLAISVIRVGYTSDFCMRVSIPLILMIILMVIKSIGKSAKTREYIILLPLIIVLAIGAITPINELSRTLSETYDRIEKGELVYEASVEQEVISNSQNFVGNLDGSIFQLILK